jgi:ABC-type glycerol-3-phosphate transport system substrate-binding protein
MKQRLKFLAAVATVSIALAGTVHAGNAADNVNIRFVWGNMEAPQKQAWIDYLIKPFEAANPGITVDFQPIPDEDNAVKVQLNSPTGAPDIFMADATEIPTYEAAGLLLPLDKYVDEYNLKNIIYPWALSLGNIDGHYYSVPHEYEATVMIYNNDLLKANGWPVPRTREQFVQVCDAALKKGIIPVSYGSSGFVLGQQWLYEKYLTNYGGVNAVRDLFTGKVKFTDPEIKGSFQMLKDDWDKGYWAEKKSSSIGMEQSRSLWLSGKALFLAEGTWLQSTLGNGATKFDWEATSWPSMKDGKPSASAIAVGAVMGVSKYTKHPDAVGKLIGFMYTHNDLMAESVAHGLQPLSMPFDLSSLPPDTDKDSRKMLEALQAVTKDPSNVSYAPWAFYPTKTNVYLMNKLDALFYNQLSLDDYLNNAQKILDQELADGFEFRAPAAGGTGS